jgi:dTDP-4-amino-4,6-dideoxygalactose transaminase
MGAMTVKTTMNVPLLDLRAQYATIKAEMDAAIHRVLDSARFIGGPEVSGLEEEVARYSRSPHAVACASGTDALLLSLKALGVGPGDEVVTCAYSFFASAGVVVNAGATPVFIDIDPATYNLDAHRLEAAITPSTKAVIAVHLYGQCCDLGAVKAVCEKKKVWLIEDAAQAIGAEWEGRRAGSVGDLGCFSFFPSKNLGGAGDGGMVVAQDAAILRVKLKHLDRWSEKRALNAALYDQLLEGSRIGRPFRDARARHIFNQYVVRVPNRDAVRTRMTDRGIGTEVYYPVPLHLQQCFAMLGHQPGDMPHSEAAARETLALPIYPELTEDQIRYVATTLRDVVDMDER